MQSFESEIEDTPRGTVPASSRPPTTAGQALVVPGTGTRSSHESRPRTGSRNYGGGADNNAAPAAGRGEQVRADNSNTAQDDKDAKTRYLIKVPSLGNTTRTVGADRGVVVGQGLQAPAREADAPPRTNGVVGAGTNGVVNGVGVPPGSDRTIVTILPAGEEQHFLVPEEPPRGDRDFAAPVRTPVRDEPLFLEYRTSSSGAGGFAAPQEDPGGFAGALAPLRASAYFEDPYAPQPLVSYDALYNDGAAYRGEDPAVYDGRFVRYPSHPSQQLGAGSPHYTGVDSAPYRPSAPYSGALYPDNPSYPHEEGQYYRPPHHTHQEQHNNTPPVAAATAVVTTLPRSSKSSATAPPGQLHHGAISTWQTQYMHERKLRLDLEKRIKFYEDRVLRQRDLQQLKAAGEERVAASYSRQAKICGDYESQLEEKRNALLELERELDLERVGKEEDERQMAAQIERHQEWQQVCQQREAAKLSQISTSELTQELIRIRRAIAQRESDIEAYRVRVVDDMSNLQSEIDLLKVKAGSSGTDGAV